MSRAARAYDLSTPAPLPRESARRLETQRESLGEELRIHVRRLLRLRTEVAVGSPDVARVRHFADWQDGKAWWYSGGAKHDPGGRGMLLGCAPDLVYAAIDRQLGGDGRARATGKPPTAIELELGMRFLRDLFLGLARAAALPPLQIELAPSRPLTEPLLTFMPDLEEPFARIPLTVKVHDAEHPLLWCVSRRLLEAVEPKPEERGAARGELAEPLATSPLELIVELARCRLTVDEAAALAPGDVVLFEVPPGEPIEVQVQGKPRFHARLGTHGGRYAIEVVDVLDPKDKPAAAEGAAKNGVAAEAVKGAPAGKAAPAAKPAAPETAAKAAAAAGSAPHAARPAAPTTAAAANGARPKAKGA